MAKEDVDIEQAINAWVEWTSENLNITPTEDEIATKRKELERGAGIVPVGAEVEEVTSWAELQQLPADQVTIVDDFVKLDDKRLLLGKPFVVSRFWFSMGDVSDYATMRVILADDNPINTPDGPTNRVVITDGSKGIYEQLRKVATLTGKTTNLFVRHGLRVSTYDVDTEEGTKKASTFYLT